MRPAIPLLGSWRGTRGHLPICSKLHASQKINGIKASTSLHSGTALRGRRFSPTFPCKTVFQNRPQRQSGFGEDGVPAKLFLPCGFEQIGR
jgi:hypothetical protein